MEKWDLDDYLEEIKFEMTQYEELTKEVILEWENKAREWALSNNDNKRIFVKNKDDISIMVKDEDIMHNIALQFYNSYIKGEEEKYWKKFKL